MSVPDGFDLNSHRHSDGDRYEEGALDGELLIEDNGSNSPQVVQLDGSGQ